MNFYIRRCQHCRAPLEQEPDASRDYGYPIYICWDCTDVDVAGDNSEDDDATPTT